MGDIKDFEKSSKLSEGITKLQEIRIDFYYQIGALKCEFDSESFKLLSDNEKNIRRKLVDVLESQVLVYSELIVLDTEKMLILEGVEK